MPNKSITVLNGDGSTRTITIPDRSRYAGRRTITKEDGSTLTVDRTAPVITSDRKGQSRPLLSKLVGGAAAAYSLRDLNDRAGRNKVVRVRRASDNHEKDFTAADLRSGKLTNWVNSQIVPPLDIGVETANGRPSVPEGGTSIGTPAAAYSLRNLSTTYTGNVVEVRRSSDNAERDFTAAELADGTLEDWVNAVGVARNRTSAARWSSFTATSTGFNAAISQAGACGFDLVGSSGISIQVSFDVVINSGSFSVQLRDGFESGSLVSNSETINSSGSKSVTLTATSDFVALQFISASADVEITNFSIDVPWTYDGHVATWYDQSGNDNHATQTNNAKQPKIVDAGTYLGEIDFPSSSATLGFSNIACGTTYSLFCALPGLDVNNFKILSGGGGAPRIDFESGHPDKIEVVDNNYSNKKFDTSNAFIDNDNLTSIINASTAVNVFYNGNASSTNPFTIPNNNTFNTLGGQAAGGAYELIIYTSDQSDNRAAIEANIGEHYGISGIPAYDNTVNGFVETWYDQSGNGNDATQTVTANQPKIVDAGGLVLDSRGHAAIDFDGVNDRMNLTSSLVASGAYSTIVYHEFNAPSMILKGDLNSPRLQVASDTRFQIGSYSPVVTANYIVASSKGLVSVLKDASHNARVYANGTESTDGQQNVGSGSSPFTKLATTTSNGPANGKIMELIYYDSDQSANRTAIEANINNQYSIY